jgi:hypothetical protein
LEKYFGSLSFLHPDRSQATIFKTSGEKMIFHFPLKLPAIFFPLFQMNSIFFSSSTFSSCRRFDVGKIPGRHHGFHLHYAKGEKIWKLYHSTNTKFLAHCKNLLLYLDGLYKFHAFEEWNRVREKIPKNLGLFGTIFTTIACNLDSCSWHIDPCDLEFAVLIYAGEWQGGCLNLGLPETPLQLTLKPADIIFLKSSRIFHSVQEFEHTRKNFSIYSHLIKGSPDVIEERGKPFLLQ